MCLLANRLDENNGFSETLFKFKVNGLLATLLDPNNPLLSSDLIAEGEIDVFFLFELSDSCASLIDWLLSAFSLDIFLYSLKAELNLDEWYCFSFAFN